MKRSRRRRSKKNRDNDIHNDLDTPECIYTTVYIYERSVIDNLRESGSKWPKEMMRERAFSFVVLYVARTCASQKNKVEEKKGKKRKSAVLDEIPYRVIS